MPLFRRVLHTGGNSIVVATPATTGSTQVMFRVTTEDGRSCCCPTVDPTCDDLAWDYPIYDDLEFLMDNTVVPAVPPWSEVSYDPLVVSLSTSGEGVTLVPEVAQDQNGNLSLARYSRFDGQPALRIDTQFNVAQPIPLTFPPSLLLGGTGSLYLNIVYYANATPTFAEIARLQIHMTFGPAAGDTGDSEWTLELFKYNGVLSTLVGTDSGTEPTYRIDADPGGGGLYDAGYYQFRLALVDDGATVGAYLNDVLILSSSSEYIRDDVSLTDCIVQASMSTLGTTWEDDIPNPIFELWQFDVT